MCQQKRSKDRKLLALFFVVLRFYFMDLEN